VAIRVKKPQDLGAASLFILMGVAGLWFGSDLRFGTNARMGPGYFPIVLSWLLIGFGGVIAIRAFLLEGASIVKPNFRGLGIVFLAILLFGLLIDRAGLGATALLVPLLAAFATPEVNWKEAVVLSISLAIACVLVFIYALRQPMQVFVWS
jgi:hypothetical protein